jgi:hypothetical protein
MYLRRLVLVLSLSLLLGGCEMLGIESPEKIAALKEGEGKAVGSACRHANRALEDCYALNPKALKAAVLSGWREMDEYMREHKIDGVTPTVAHHAARPEARPGAAVAETKSGSAAPAKASPAHDS